MKRTSLNLVIDLAAALAFLGMAATGYLLYFPLPPGTNRTLMLWGWTRHRWGEVHSWISLALLGILLTHVVLHWQWLASVIAKRLPFAGRSRIGARTAGAAVVGVLIAGLVLFALAAHNGVTGIQPGTTEVCPPEGERAAGGGASRIDEVDFWRGVYPVLESRCLPCHGPGRQRGDFRADRKADYFGEGAGEPLVTPGERARSPLIAIVSGARPDMPLAGRHKLPEQDVELLKAWIDAGAPWPERPPTDR